MRWMRRGLASAGLCLLLAMTSVAAEYPSRAVKIVVGFAPGTGTDILARILAEQLHARFKQPFVVENRPGAAAQIAAEFVAHATPDGYTLLLTSNASHSINPHLYRKLPYDPIADFTPIERAADFPLVFIVTPKLPVATPAQLVDYIRTHSVSYASPSRIGQVIVSALASQLSLNLNEVDYASSPAALQDVAAGREAFGVFDFASSQAFLKAGKLRAIAVTTSGRSLLAPDLPPVGEALGLEPTDLRAWTGFFGPAKLPGDIANTLSAALGEILIDPSVKDRMLAAGIEPSPLPPAQFAAFVKEQLTLWGQKVAAAHIEPQ